MKKLVIIILAGAATFAHAGLTHHWSFDEGTGTNTADLAGSNPGTIIGASWATDGVRGTYLSFDGSNDSVDPSLFNPQWSAANAESWAVWVYSDPLAVNQNRDDIILGNRLDGTTETTVGTRLFAKMTTREDSNGRFVYNDGTAYQMNLSAAGRTEVLPVGEWYHLAVVRDGADFTIYVNGTAYSDSSYSVGAGDMPTAAMPFFIGGEAGAAVSEHFGGGLDDVRIYDHALTAGEVAALIPEPATFGLIAAFGGAVLFIRRRFVI